LLSISEAVISCNLGQPIDIDRYHSLRASVEQLADDDAFSDIEVKRIAETRSGSGISTISVPDGDEEGYVAIFKDGEKRKLKEERAGVESWHEIFPGLAPRILSYKKRGQSASLLIEHLAGLTFEQILLHEPQALVKQTLDQLGRMLGSIWKETRSDTQVSADFMRQLARRLDEVYSIHPEFRQANSTICGYAVPSFDELLLRASDYESGVRRRFRSIFTVISASTISSMTHWRVKSTISICTVPATWTMFRMCLCLWFPTTGCSFSINSCANGFSA